MTNFGVSLYTVRELEEPIDRTLRRISELGYNGVELYNRLHGNEVDRIRPALEETDLEPIAVHIGLREMEKNLDDLVERYDSLGCQTFVFDPGLFARTHRRVSNLVHRVSRVSHRLNKHGFRMIFHPNHRDMVPMLRGPLSGRLPWYRHDLESSLQSVWPELNPVDGLFHLLGWKINRLANGAYDRFLGLHRNGLNRDVDWLRTNSALGYWFSNTDPSDLAFEIDIGFLVQLGFDPVEIIDLWNNRIIALHVKDVDSSDYQLGGWPTWVDPGDGDADFSAVCRAAQETGIEWLVFENGTPDDPIRSIERGISAIQP